MKKLSVRSRKFILSVALLVGLFLLNLFLSQTIMSLNLALKDSQEQIEIGMNVNRQLKVTASKYAATESLLKQAKKLGFIETKNIVYLSPAEILAKND